MAPWDLTDAVDAGDTAKALDLLHRTLGDPRSHTLAVIASLHRHVQQLLRLDGSGATSQEDAAQILGIHAFPAKKALAQSRRLGTERIARAVRLLADTLEVPLIGFAGDADRSGAGGGPGGRAGGPGRPEVERGDGDR